MGIMNFACSNCSQDSLTPERWLISPQYRAATLTLSVFLIVFMLIGIPWNLLLIVVIIKKRLFENPAILLLLNLAFTDFLFCLMVMPINIVPAVAGEFIFGNNDYARCIVCHLAVAWSVLLLMSVYNVVLLSVDRFLYVKKPLQYKNIVTLKRVAVTLTAFWVFFIAFSILPVFGVGLIVFIEVLPACTLLTVPGLTTSYVYYWTYIAFVCFVPAVILVVTNTWMMWIMKKSIRRVYIRAKSNSVKSDTSATLQLKGKYTKDQIRLLQIFAALFVFSIMTWLPTVITTIMVHAANLFVLEFTTFASVCFNLQPIIHPILQFLLLKNVRSVVAKLTPCQCTSNSAPNTPESSNNDRKSRNMSK